MTDRKTHCRQCGKPFGPTVHANRLYCSQGCRQAAYRARRDAKARAWITNGTEQWVGVAVPGGKYHAARAQFGEFASDKASWAWCNDRMFLDGGTEQRIVATMPPKSLCARCFPNVRTGPVWPLLPRTRTT